MPSMEFAAVLGGLDGVAVDVRPDELGDVAVQVGCKSAAPVLIARPGSHAAPRGNGDIPAISGLAETG